MKSILTFLTRGLGDLLSGFVKTKGSSKDGSTGSTGSGQSNGINWTMVIVILVVAGGLYLIPSPLQSGRQIPPQSTSHTEIAIPGIPDTSYTSVEPVRGRDNTLDNVTYVATLPEITIRYMPSYVENEIILPDSGDITGRIRATAYPFIDGDTLKIDLPIEYNLEAKPYAEIIRTDTLFSIDSLFFVEEVSWIEKPAVVAGGVSALWLLLIIFL